MDKYADECIIHHAVKYERPDEFEAHKTRGRVSRNNATYAFKVTHGNNAPLYALVGENARGIMQEKRKGVLKYTSDYMSVYMTAVLLRLLPHGHDNIILGIGHPPNAWQHTKQLKQSVGGSYRVELPSGDVFKYRIRYVTTFEENGGGVVRAMTRRSSNFNHDGLNDGDYIVICDIGGQIGSIYIAQIQDSKPVINFDAGRTFEIGIDDVKRNLNNALRANHPDVFKWDIDDVILEQILRTRGTATIFNKQHVFRDEFNSAISPLVHSIQSFYDNDLRTAMQAKVVYCTGGGSGILHQVLSEDVFKHTTRLTDRPEEIQQANARGGAYMIRQHVEYWVNRKRELAKIVDGNHAAIVADMGNSFAKGILL